MTDDVSVSYGSDYKVYRKNVHRTNFQGEGRSEEDEKEGRIFGPEIQIFNVGVLKVVGQVRKDARAIIIKAISYRQEEKKT